LKMILWKISIFHSSARRDDEKAKKNSDCRHTYTHFLFAEFIFHRLFRFMFFQLFFSHFDGKFSLLGIVTVLPPISDTTDLSFFAKLQCFFPTAFRTALASEREKLITVVCSIFAISRLSHKEKFSRFTETRDLFTVFFSFCSIRIHFFRNLSIK
jgi:hypothetical protein